MKRRGCIGWEAGTTYNQTPTDGNITVTTGSKRTGTYGLDVNAQSGVKSTLNIASNSLPSPDMNNGHYRAYINWQTLPSVARMFHNFSGTVSNASNIELRINTDGTVSMMNNGNVIGTSAVAMVTGRWYCLEVGIHGDSDYVAMRIDESMEIDWVDSGGSPSSLTGGVHVGAVDTAASAMRFFLDDIAWDAGYWCGPGRVKRLGITAIKTDNATWSNVGGASKWQSVNEITPDDDTSYILSSTITNTIMFSIANVDADVKTVNGLSLWVRAKRDGASNGSFTGRVGTGAYITTATPNNFANTSKNTTSAWQTLHCDGLSAWSALGPFWDVADFADFSVGLNNASSNPSRVSAIWVEIDYNDHSNGHQHDQPIMIAMFNDGPNDFLATTNGLVTGTAVGSTDQIRIGTQSLKVTHAAGGQSRARFGLGNRAVWYLSACRYEWSVWFYMTALPSSGSVGIVGYLNNVSLDFDVRVSSTGVISSNFRVVAGSDVITSPAGTIAINTWYHLRVQCQIASATSVATDGFAKVWIDDVLVHHKSGANPGTDVAPGVTLPYCGTAINCAGGATVYYSGFVFSFVRGHNQHTKFQTLVPTGAGQTSDAGFTVVGPANKWEALDEIPNDGDTSYVLSPLSTTLLERYATADIDTRAVEIFGYCLYFLAKRDGGVNSIFSVATQEANLEQNILGQILSITASSAYGSNSKSATVVVNPYGGELDTAEIDRLELYYKAADGANKTRLTSIQMIVCYSQTYPRARQRSGGLGIVG